MKGAFYVRGVGDKWELYRREMGQDVRICLVDDRQTADEIALAVNTFPLLKGVSRELGMGRVGPNSQTLIQMFRQEEVRKQQAIVRRRRRDFLDRVQNFFMTIVIGILSILILWGLYQLFVNWF